MLICSRDRDHPNFKEKKQKEHQTNFRMLSEANITKEDRNKYGAQTEEESKYLEVDMNIDFRMPYGNSNEQREPLVKRRFAHSRRQHSNDEGEKEQDSD